MNPFLLRHSSFHTITKYSIFIALSSETDFKLVLQSSSIFEVTKCLLNILKSDNDNDAPFLFEENSFSDILGIAPSMHGAKAWF